jgi:hypothetical protein
MRLSRDYIHPRRVDISPNIFWGEQGMLVPQLLLCITGNGKFWNPVQAYFSRGSLNPVLGTSGLYIWIWGPTTKPVSPNLIYSKLYPVAISGLDTFSTNLSLHVTCEERDESSGGGIRGTQVK